MTLGPDLLAIGRAHMDTAHEFILVGGALGVLSIFAALFSRRLGAAGAAGLPGARSMLAGEDGPGGIAYADFSSAYLIGSVALAVILFEGGLKTPLSMLRLALWPALALAVAGVGITAGIVAAAVMVVGAVPFSFAMLIGAAVAPTDAAAVGAMLGQGRIALPKRLTALLEVESGLNDPMSIFLTIFVIRIIVEPTVATWQSGALLFAQEMIGGAALGVGGGLLLAQLLRRVSFEIPTAMVLVLTYGLALFGLAQSACTPAASWRCTLAGVVVGATEYRGRQEVANFYEGFTWLAHIVLFLMLGLLVTPHDLIPFIPVSILIAVVLMVIARPVGVFASACCRSASPGANRRSPPGGGLRGAVLIYYQLHPRAGRLRSRDQRMFSGVFVVVVASLVIQGWTIGPVARLLGFGRAD